MFTETNKRSEKDLDKGQVSVPRSERGTSAKDKQKIKKLATEPLLDRFGVPKHLVVGQGEAEDGISKIQDAFIGIAQRTKMLNDRAVEYDMFTPLMIPVLVDSTNIDMDLKWGAVDRCLLTHYGTITLEEAQEWTKDMLLYGHEDEVENQNWLLQFVRNSCTEGLRARIDVEFDKLEKAMKGGVVYIKMMYDILVNMTDSVVTSLQRFVKTFA
jgi:hypothetical protein